MTLKKMKSPGIVTLETTTLETTTKPETPGPDSRIVKRENRTFLLFNDKEIELEYNPDQYFGEVVILQVKDNRVRYGWK